ncbi:MAG: hypothetical protein HN976_28690 [Lentisphaerae bacterium]|jgi:hypothetical protein|nr:hypothetical protein [Lentisphaerota bacterium]MBT4821828.1 hypothetical protein [Lentisphaerota bacterium]MBT7059108.1 hypothetical protein [Lentisphaerota bacterium]
MKTLIALAALVTVVGCSKAPPQQKPDPVGDKSVALLGDGTRTSFAAILEEAGITARCVDDSSVAARAKLLASADLVLVVVDSTEGPMTIHREDILLARQFAAGPVAVAFSRTDLVDDPELLELEELEMRELLAMYELDGDNAPVFFDSPRARTPMPQGAAPVRAVLEGLRPAPERDAADPWTRLSVSIYVLADEETYDRGVARPLPDGSCTAVFAGGSVSAMIQPEAAIPPGESGEGILVCSSPIGVASGERFVLSENGHVTAAGSVIGRQRVKVDQTEP